MVCKLYYIFFLEVVMSSIFNLIGKSSSSRILACYAARLDRFPIFVDLDVSQGSVSIPGSLTAVQLDKTSINIEVRTRQIIRPLIRIADRYRYFVCGLPLRKDLDILCR